MRLPVACLLLIAALANAQEASRLVDAGGPGLVQAAASDTAERRVYIVQLDEPSIVARYATVAGPVAKGQASYSKTRPDMSAWATRIVQAQDRLLARYTPQADKLYSYRYTLNGFAARMSPADAEKLRSRPEVRAVWEDEIRPLATDSSANFLGLFDNNAGLRGPRGLRGEDIVIGFIDSGIYPEHPQLSDVREAARPRPCRSSWGRNSLLGQWLCARYDRRPDELVYEAPVDWNGSCETGESFTTEDCNNKLIGARFFIEGAAATGALDPGEFRSPRDVDGHGTHTATTAAGNREPADIYGSFVGTVEGIAPRARVAAYKACWLRPGATRASCNTSDLVNAIDAAVADGVDIINYSVGSSFLEVAAPDDIALTNAARAGVLAVVAAGNDGPNLGTVGSPSSNPFVLTTAASSRDGETSREALRITEPPAVAGRYAVREASFTPALADAGPIEAGLVLADDGDTTATDGRGSTRDACQALENGDEIDGRIAFIERGGCDFDIKLRNAESAGALAALVYNVAGEPVVMNGDPTGIGIPALMIGQADASLLIAELEAGIAVTAILDKSLLLTEPETGNRMAAFSSRGPGAAGGVLKPDLTAPGVDILAGLTPDAANTRGGEEYGYLSGTSMATPHVSGVAALLLEAQPDWTPDLVKSALMTTARQDVTRDQFDTPANPFDFGAGHLDPNPAADPGLALLVDDADYDAFACAAGYPGADATGCAALADNGVSFLPEDLNLPSVSIPALASLQTTRRRLTNISDSAQTVSVSVTAPPGIDITVSPQRLSLAPGQTASFDMEFRYLDGPLDLWRFGSILWENEDHEIRLPVAVQPVSLSAPDFVDGSGGTGSAQFGVDFGYTGSYTAQVHGLNLPLVIDGFVDNDPDKSFSFRPDNGVTIHLVDVPADQLYLRFALFNELTDGDDDLDLYVYYCPDAINCNRIGESGAFDSNEEFNQPLPLAGRYAVLVHGFETDDVNGGPGANYTLLGWSFGTSDDQGNMTVTAPSFVNAGTSETLILNWSGLATDTIYLGGVSHLTPQGLAALTVIRIIN